MHLNTHNHDDVQAAVHGCAAAAVLQRAGARGEAGLRPRVPRRAEAGLPRRAQAAVQTGRAPHLRYSILTSSTSRHQSFLGAEGNSGLQLCS